MESFAAFWSVMVLAGPLAATAPYGVLRDACATSKSLVVVAQVRQMPPVASAGSVSLDGAGKPAVEDFEGYLRLHSEVVGGNTRSLLMPWPGLRTLTR